MARRAWHKYLNTQEYVECQLVTALNAYYYLTGRTYCKQSSKDYEDLVDLCGGRYGAAVDIRKVHRKLGLVILEKHRFLHNFLEKFYGKGLVKTKTIRKTLPLPIEMCVWHKRTGFHSALIVDYSKKCDAIRVCNFKDATALNGWMFLEDLYQWETQLTLGDNGVNSNGRPWRYRLFGIRES